MLRCGAALLELVGTGMRLLAQIGSTWHLACTPGLWCPFLVPRTMGARRPCPIEDNMPRPVNHSPGAQQRAHRILQETSDIEELRAAQAYLLPLAGLTLDQVALMLGRDRYWVSRTRNRFIRGQKTLTHGGRRQSLVPEDQELAMVKRAFISPDRWGWRQGATTLRTNLRFWIEKATDADVAESTITAMLNRVAPKILVGATAADLQRHYYSLRNLLDFEQKACEEKGISWP